MLRKHEFLGGGAMVLMQRHLPMRSVPANLAMKDDALIAWAATLNSRVELEGRGPQAKFSGQAGGRKSTRSKLSRWASAEFEWQVQATYRQGGWVHS